MAVQLEHAVPGFATGALLSIGQAFFPQEDDRLLQVPPALIECFPAIEDACTGHLTQFLDFFSGNTHD